MPLEDELSDILKKARTGQQRSVADVARASSLPEVELTELERGQAPRGREQVQAVARALGLREEPLSQVAEGWVPHVVPASMAVWKPSMAPSADTRSKGTLFMIEARPS